MIHPKACISHEAVSNGKLMNQGGKHAVVKKINASHYLLRSDIGYGGMLRCDMEFRVVISTQC